MVQIQRLFHIFTNSNENLHDGTSNEYKEIVEVDFLLFSLFIGHTIEKLLNFKCSSAINSTETNSKIYITALFVFLRTKGAALLVHQNSRALLP